MLLYLLAGVCFLLGLIAFLLGRSGRRSMKIGGNNPGIAINGSVSGTVSQVRHESAGTDPPPPSAWQQIGAVIQWLMPVIGTLIIVLAYFFPRG